MSHSAEKTLSDDLSPVENRGKSRLTQGQKPTWTWIAVLVGSLILGAAATALLGGGAAFSVGGWLVLSFILYVVAMYIVTRVIENGRKATDGLWRNLIYGAFLLALLPLVSVIWTVLSQGIPGLMNPGFFASDMNGVTGAVDLKTAREETNPLGGIQHAVVGSLLITLTATLISVPIGLLTSIYLVEYGRDGWLSKAITFFVDVMTGIPSIVAGLFAAGVMAALVGRGANVMGFSAAVALSVLMIPVVVRSTEEMLRVVPNELREASYALGVRKWRTILKVVIPTAISGIASGVTLAIARVIGETAPILVTAGVALTTNWSMFKDWMMSLPVYIYRQLMNPTAPGAPDISSERAWGAALVLILIVMILNLIARIIAKAFAPKKTGR
ncbi:phosphate ABC transporter permease PstA [Neomicrococcus lactis]|uniref:phosphate ABC transporter permease PstA n=1 Tax=Neomicrococcus lactis TaxID=732241 RepID=UPI0016158F8C|nr:phosphate ABC transporter permease PstA [Neomicrococcus lactis]